MQCHVILWLLVSLIGHLAEPMWWSGNAAWWLASAELSPWFSAHYLSDKPYLINFLSHGFLFVHLMTIGLLFRQNYRPLAIAAALLMAIGVWLLAGDWLYGLAIILCTSPFWGTAVRELRCEFSEVSNLEIETEDRQPEKKNPVIRRPARRLGT